MEVCRQDSLACENEVRVHGGQKYIFKRCKQELACRNNQIQVRTPLQLTTFDPREQNVHSLLLRIAEPASGLPAHSVQRRHGERCVPMLLHEPHV